MHGFYFAFGVMLWIFAFKDFHYHLPVDFYLLAEKDKEQEVAFMPVEVKHRTLLNVAFGLLCVTISMS